MLYKDIYYIGIDLYKHIDYTDYSLLGLLFLIFDCFYFAFCQSSFKRLYDTIFTR